MNAQDGSVGKVGQLVPRYEEGKSGGDSIGEGGADPDDRDGLPAGRNGRVAVLQHHPTLVQAGFAVHALNHETSGVEDDERIGDRGVAGPAIEWRS